MRKTFRALFVVFIVCLACTASAADRAKRINGVGFQSQAKVPTPITIISVIPAQAEPGVKITLSGSGFEEKSAVLLGNVEVATRVVSEKQIEFNVPPKLEAGLYALYVKRSDGTTGRTYNFTVLPVRPVLSSLQPDRISICAAGKEREVIASGSHFGATTMLFFNGAVLGSTLVTAESISFTVPTVPGGLYHVHVKNSPENSSVSLILAVETRPEIAYVTVGSEHVNYYELIISGTNFNHNSSLYVDGVQLGGRGGQDMVDREKLIYVDCTKLIYQRHPYSPVNKDFRLQVVNAGGEGSQVITVSAP